ncbi:hypothetical protein HN446_03975 [bacterium]|nr:hypothetical protein [bacterium]
MKKIFQTKLLLKVIALIYAYFLWLMISQSFFTTLKLDLPIIFFDIPKNIIASGPEFLNINVSGRRFDLRDFISHGPSFNISAKTLSNGANIYTVSQEDILLPEEVKLVDYNPSIFDINITQKNE